jgi:hypothetical protein
MVSESFEAGTVSWVGPVSGGGRNFLIGKHFLSTSNGIYLPQEFPSPTREKKKQTKATPYTQGALLSPSVSP